MNKDLISRSALKKQLKKKQLKKKIYLDKNAEFERGYHFAINVCINLLNIFPTVETYTKEDMRKEYQRGITDAYKDNPPI